MSTIPLRIDSGLVNQAREAGAVADRPPTAQIEHWAKLGRVLDAVLTGASLFTVKKLSRVPSLDDIVAASQTKEGREKTRAVIFSHGGPTYSADPENPALILERSPDGSVKRGRFLNRKFVQAD
jgi:hypothetical protein